MKAGILAGIPAFFYGYHILYGNICEITAHICLMPGNMLLNNSCFTKNKNTP